MAHSAVASRDQGSRNIVQEGADSGEGHNEAGFGNRCAEVACCQGDNGIHRAFHHSKQEGGAVCRNGNLLEAELRWGCHVWGANEFGLKDTESSALRPRSSARGQRLALVAPSRRPTKGVRYIFNISLCVNPPWTLIDSSTSMLIFSTVLQRYAGSPTRAWKRTPSKSPIRSSSNEKAGGRRHSGNAYHCIWRLKIRAGAIFTPGANIGANRGPLAPEADVLVVIAPQIRPDGRDLPDRNERHRNCIPALHETMV